MKWSIRGKVVSGKQLGRTLGFPTANIQSDFAFRKEFGGVYAAWTEISGERYLCVVNIGRHPTFPEGPATVEAHVVDYSGSLYGQDMEIEIFRRLRGEVRFASAQDLCDQLRRDIVNARNAAEEHDEGGGED